MKKLLNKNIDESGGMNKVEFVENSLIQEFSQIYKKFENSFDSKSEKISPWQDLKYYYSCRRRYFYILRKLHSYKHMSLLSIGTGAGFFEYLCMKLGIADKIEIIEYPEVVHYYTSWYKHCGFKPLKVGISEIYRIGNKYDIVVAAEVIEHLQIAPKPLVLNLLKLLTVDGMIIMTTPNQAALNNIIKLVKGESIINSVEYFFDEPNWTNEHLHRRVYTKKEIEKQVINAGGILTESELFTVKSGIIKLFHLITMNKYAEFIYLRINKRS